MSSAPNFTAPSAADWSDWTQLVVFHLLGYVDRSCEVLARNRWGVYRVASTMLAQYPVELEKLYRGLVLDSTKLAAKRQIVKYENGPRILSYTEDGHAALWFADPSSSISSDLAGRLASAKGAEVGGYLEILDKVPTRRMLFHHRWTDLPMPGGTISLQLAASLNPRLDANELKWNVATHLPVLLEVPKLRTFRVRAIRELPRPATADLDRKFAYPLSLT